MECINIFWFRRDLRLEDNAGLYYALKANLPVLAIFIFDTNILDKLENKSDARVEFIYKTIFELKNKIENYNSTIKIFHDTPLNTFKILMKDYKIEKVFTNQDYENYAQKRDKDISTFLNDNNVEFLTYKDHVIFEKNEVLKDDGKPYTVFTPYSNKWKTKLTPFHYSSYPTEKYKKNFFHVEPGDIPSLNKLGFNKSSISIPPRFIPLNTISKYDKNRNYPSIEGTSRLGIHLRFGTLSIRKLTMIALNTNSTYMNELIWRDFYFSILFHFPKVGEHRAFKIEYENIEWRNDEIEFKRWCDGQTGYPIVDAGIRQLNATGFMHNRLRMITASFLSKHLLIDWRWGEAYFAEKLLDYDLAANNGGWQWAAGSGCDAAPYFRIFNPYLQTKKFDPDLRFIKSWVREFEDVNYPKPIVDHEYARKRCLEVYSKALKKNKV